MSDAYIIELNDVFCKTGNRNLLRNVTWRVKPGEHWVVFGMNGSGKTTLLSVIAGFQHYTSGEVKVFGQTFTNETMLEIRKRIGWVSSSFFDKHYSKESALHIVLSGKNGTLGLSEEITLEDVRLAKALLDNLSLAGRYDYTFDMFSKGERQNILIARALFQNPDILILDEPCTGLDVYNRNYLFDTIETLNRQKEITIIYVTHYVEEILPLFENTLLMKHGRIFEMGKTEDIFCDDVLQNLLGYPAHITKNDDGKFVLDIEAKSTLTELLTGGV